MSGDKAAVSALQDTARYLGIGISNIVWGLDPDAVIIDGTLTEAWPLVDTVIRDQFADGREFLNFRNLLLRPSALEGRAAITGAAALSFRSLFEKAQHARV
jgi:predicted NBD/HSP70 family sugar kinase